MIILIDTETVFYKVQNSLLGFLGFKLKKNAQNKVRMSLLTTSIQDYLGASK